MSSSFCMSSFTSGLAAANASLPNLPKLAELVQPCEIVLRGDLLKTGCTFPQ